MQIHIARKGVTLGSFDLDALKAKAALGEIELTDHAYIDTIGSWKLISEVPELHDALFPQTADSEQIPPPPPPPLQESSDSSKDMNEVATTKKNGIDFPLEAWKKFLSNKVVRYSAVGIISFVTAFLLFEGRNHLDTKVHPGQGETISQKLNSIVNNRSQAIKDAIYADNEICHRLDSVTGETDVIIDLRKKNDKDREHIIDALIKFAGDPVVDSLLSFLRTEQEYSELGIHTLEKKLDVLYWQDHCPRSGVGFYTSQCPEFKKAEYEMRHEGQKTKVVGGQLIDKQSRLQTIGLPQNYHW